MRHHLRFCMPLKRLRSPEPAEIKEEPASDSDDATLGEALALAFGTLPEDEAATDPSSFSGEEEEEEEELQSTVVIPMPPLHEIKKEQEDEEKNPVDGAAASSQPAAAMPKPPCGPPPSWLLAGRPPPPWRTEARQLPAPPTPFPPQAPPPAPPAPPPAPPPAWAQSEQSWARPTPPPAPPACVMLVDKNGEQYHLRPTDTHVPKSRFPFGYANWTAEGWWDPWQRLPPSSRRTSRGGWYTNMHNMAAGIAVGIVEGMNASKGKGRSTQHVQGQL